MTKILEGTIANGESLSSAIKLNFHEPVKIMIPGAWTAADMTFKGSIDGTNFTDVRLSSGSLLSLSGIPTSGSVIMNIDGLDELMSIKLQSYEGGAKAQGATRRIKIICV